MVKPETKFLTLALLVFVATSKVSRAEDSSHKTSFDDDSAPQTVESKLSKLVKNSGFDDKEDLVQALRRGLTNMSSDDIALLEQFINSPEAAKADPEVRNYLDAIAKQMLAPPKKPMSDESVTAPPRAAGPPSSPQPPPTELGESGQASLEKLSSEIKTMQADDDWFMRESPTRTPNEVKPPADLKAQTTKVDNSVSNKKAPQDLNEDLNDEQPDDPAQTPIVSTNPDPTDPYENLERNFLLNTASRTFQASSTVGSGRR